MKELTRDFPKPLLEVSGRSILEHKLESLPEIVDEIVLIVGFKKEKILKKFGDSYRGIPIRFVEDKKLTGTAHALWQAKDILKGRFLVMMGDDIYDRKAMEECAKHDFSLVCIRAKREETGSRVLLNETNNPTGFVTHKMYLTLKEDGGLIFTGLYSLTTDIFKYEPVKLDTKDEWGLPQTILELAKDNKIEIIETNFWLPIGTPEELKAAQNAI